MQKGGARQRMCQMDVLVPSVCSNKGADKCSTIFLPSSSDFPSSSFFISPFTSCQNQLPSLGFDQVHHSLLFFSSVSFPDSGLTMDFGPANPTKQTSQEYSDHRISEWAMLIFHVMSHDGHTGKNQTASLFVGLLKGKA